jgi:hypothetical protein
MITKKEVTRIKEWYDDYVTTYIVNESDYGEDIKSKYLHSLRVAGNCVDIGTSLHFSRQHLLIAELLGLLHDVGRFSQLKLYKTYIDRKSIDHGCFGVQTLKEHDVLSGLEEPVRKIVVCAIANHNKKMIESGLSGEEELFTRLLRDADKLDIYNMLIQLYSGKEKVDKKKLILDLPDGPGLSEEICDDLLRGTMASVEHLRTINDFKLLKLGWVYDVNFPRTLSIIQEKRYLPILYDLLPHTETVKEIYEIVERFMAEHVTQ